MADYEQAFDRLFHYAFQYYSFEDHRTRKSIRGLRPEIRGELLPLSITSYHDAVQKAMLVEREEAESHTTFFRPRHSERGFEA